MVDSLHKLSSLLIWTFNVIIVIWKITLSTLHYFFYGRGVNIKSKSTNDGSVLEVIWGSWRSADEPLWEQVGDGRFQGEGRDKQRLILSDRQRRAALVWQRSCSFNASHTWRQSPTSLSLHKHRETLAWLWVRRLVEFCSGILILGYLFSFWLFSRHSLARRSLARSKVRSRCAWNDCLQMSVLTDLCWGHFVDVFAQCCTLLSFCVFNDCF